MQDIDKVHCCSADFDVLALLRFDMTFADTLRDGSSFAKLTNPSYVLFSLLLAMFIKGARELYFR